MKNRKWLTYTLGVLFTLIALAVVGMAGFRIGMRQNISTLRIANPPMMQGVNPRTNSNTGPNGNDNFGGNPKFMQGNSRGHDFNSPGFGRGRGSMSIFGGLFGLIHLAVLALLVWFGYKLVQKSDWRLVRVQTASTASESPSAEEEEKKE